ncbi:MAG: hypothetical protein F9K19_25255 [Rhizobiaceae bacterium]|nr:MAG: hypothetical protein F9K19_25255 [Rhizobiaceae bacterium]
MKITSNFVMLDVREGKDQLRAHFSDRRVGPSRRELHLPVVIRGRIYGVIGHDDGVSIEMGVVVDEVSVDGLPDVSGLPVSDKTDTVNVPTSRGATSSAGTDRA